MIHDCEEKVAAKQYWFSLFLTHSPVNYGNMACRQKSIAEKERDVANKQLITIVK